MDQTDSILLAYLPTNTIRSNKDSANPILRKAYLPAR